MPNPWLNEHKSTAAMNYFLIHRQGRNLCISTVGENPRWVCFHRIFVYTCKQSNIMCSCCIWPHGNGLVGFYSLQKLFKLCFSLFPIDNLSAQVLKVDIYRHKLVPFPWGHIQQLHMILLCLHVYTNMRWKHTHLGFSPTDVSATSHRHKLVDDI
jgi:hypothetical protein